MYVSSSPPDIGNTQNDVQHETFEEKGILNEQMANVRRKHPFPSRRRKDVRNGEFDEIFEHLVNVIEQENK